MTGSALGLTRLHCLAVFDLLEGNCSIDDRLSDKFNGAAVFALLLAAANLVLLKDNYFVVLTIALQDGSWYIQSFLWAFSRPVSANIKSIDEKYSFMPTVQVSKNIPERYFLTKHLTLTKKVR